MGRDKSVGQVFRGPAVIDDPPRYPILVRRLERDQALRIACQVCPWETTISGEDIRNERNYLCPRCEGPADYKFEEADYECPNCGKLGFLFPDAYKPCCSRVCGLQWEYAQNLLHTSREQADG